MKDCKDCKWCFSEYPLANNPENYCKCDYPSNIVLTEGDNIIIRRWSYCDTHREAGFIFSYCEGLCGKRGRWFKRIPVEVKIG